MLQLGGVRHRDTHSLARFGDTHLSLRQHDVDSHNDCHAGLAHAVRSFSDRRSTTPGNSRSNVAADAPITRKATVMTRPMTGATNSLSPWFSLTWSRW